MKKLFCFIISFLFALNLNIVSSFASEKIEPTIQDLKNLNNGDWNEFLNELDVNSESAISGEFYMKVYETPDKLIMDDKTYTYDEYIAQSGLRADISNGTNWIKFFYSVYPRYNDPTYVGVIGGFEWLKTPLYKYTDTFTISSDGNLVIPGANEKVNVAFWPNISCPTVVGSYTTGDSKIEFDTYGITGKFKLSGYDFQDQILNTSNWYNYFTVGTDGYSTLGCPKGTVGFSMRRANSSTENGKIAFTYNHRQVVLNFEPEISVDSSGNVTLEGITGGLGYDKVTTSVRYEWGSTIN